MYQFVHSLSYTASIFILMIICMERYFAIIYPITCKQILTPTRLRVSITISSLLHSFRLFCFFSGICAPKMSIQKCYKIKFCAEIEKKSNLKIQILKCISWRFKLFPSVASMECSVRDTHLVSLHCGKCIFINIIINPLSSAATSSV